MCGDVCGVSLLTFAVINIIVKEKLDNYRKCSAPKVTCASYYNICDNEDIEGKCWR